MVPTIPHKHRMHPAMRLRLGRSARLALVALSLCLAVPAVAAFEGWEIDAAHLFAP